MKFLPAALPTLLLGFLWSFSLFVTAEVRMDGNPYLIARLVPHAAKLSILKGSNRPTTSSGIYWRRLYRPTEVKEHRERYGKNSQLIERSSLSNGPLGALSFHSLWFSRFSFPAQHYASSADGRPKNTYPPKHKKTGRPFRNARFESQIRIVNQTRSGVSGHDYIMPPMPWSWE